MSNESLLSRVENGTGKSSPDRHCIPIFPSKYRFNGKYRKPGKKPGKTSEIRNGINSGIFLTVLPVPIFNREYSRGIFPYLQTNFYFSP